MEKKFTPNYWARVSTKSGFFLICFSLLYFFTTIGWAETREEMKARIQEKAAEIKAKIQEAVEAKKAEIKAKLEEGKAKFQEKLEAGKAKLQEKIEEAKSKANAQKEERRARYDSQKDEFRTHFDRQIQENRSFLDGLKGKSPDEIKVSMEEHYQKQRDENKALFRDQHNERMTAMSENLSENQLLSQDQKKKFLSIFEDLYNSGEAFNDVQYDENRDFLKKLSTDGSLSYDEKVQAWRKHVDSQIIDRRKFVDDSTMKVRSDADKTFGETPNPGKNQ